MRKFLFYSLLMWGANHLWAKQSFQDYADMCEKTQTQECSNYHDEVVNLQRVLNARVKGLTPLKLDGKWGEKTKEAVILFQKQYHISPVEGYVGRKTKYHLARLSRGIKCSPVQKHHSKRSYHFFKQHVNLRKSYKVFKNSRLLSLADKHNTQIQIDVHQQRLRLLVGGEIALDTPCTTGAKKKFEPNTKIYRDKHTPLGTYRIREKLANKRSTIFGDIYRNGKKIYHGDRRKYHGSWKGVRYVGASLKHWMRLTSSGIGLHASKYIKRYPGTNGCIRLPEHIAPLVFSKVKQGTKVTIR